MERGQDYLVEINGVKVGKLNTATLNRERELIETNNFDSPDNAESIVGMYTTTLDMEAFYVYSDAGQQAVETAFADTTTPATARLTSLAGTSGAYEWTGSLWITQLEQNFEMNEVVGYSISGTFTGAVTRAVIS